MTESINQLPQSWVRYLISSEPKLFVLAAVSKSLYSAGLIGVTMLVLRMQTIPRGNFSEALQYCFIFLAVAAVFQLAGQGNSYFSGQLAGRVKARLAALVSEHAILRASPEASERATALSLASAEAHQVCEGALFIHELWLAPLNILAVVGILIQSSGYTTEYGYIGGGMCIVVLLIMSYISILLVRARKAVGEIESKQISVFVEVLENIRTLRFYGWDSYMLQKLHKMTDAMAPLRRKLIFLKMLNIGTSFIISPFMVLVLLTTYAVKNGRLNASFLYLVTSLFDITKYSLLALPSSVRACSGAAAAYARIIEYFKRPSYEDKRELIGFWASGSSESTGIVQLIGLPVGPKSVLKEWRADAGSLWVFQGPVRSFKTTLLECIAGHYPLTSVSKVRVGGKMSYAPQVPWLQQTSIKDNIVCCEPWDAARYKAVIHACALELDLQNMPLGDATPIAEKGISLSGGQRQRVGLARAAYRDADIYVLDNPISALDDQTQEHIWKHLCEGLLQHATIIVGSSRPVISCTAVLHLTADGLKPCEPQFYNGWCADQRSDALPPRYAPGKAPTNARSEVSQSAGKSIQVHDTNNEIRAPTTRQREGSSRITVEDASVSDVREEVKDFEKFSVSGLQAPTAASERSESEMVSLHPDNMRQFLSQRAPRTESFLDQLEQKQSQKQSIMRSRRQSSFASFLQSQAIAEGNSDLEIKVEKPSDQSSKQSAADVNEQDKFQASPSEVGFIQWISACDIGYSFALIVFLSYFFHQVSRSYFTSWITWWNNLYFGLSSSTFNYVLGGLLGSQIVFRVLTDYLVFSAGTKGAQRMRKAFCTSVINAPMSFFMTENLGPIVQVFSRDLNIVSEDLIDAFHYAVLYSCIFLAIVVRTAIDFPIFLAIAIPVLMLAGLILRTYQQKLKVVKTEFKKANDELFHAICDSIEGVKVLRTADGTVWAIDLLNEAFLNARIAIVASENCNIWLMRRLDPISVILSFATLVMSTQMNTEQFPLLSQSVLNLAIQQSLSYLVFVQWSLKNVGNAVYSMGSVERIQRYIKEIPHEPRGGHDLDQLWPKSGEMEFKDLCLKYSPPLPLALDHVSFKLEHGAKVGVVGRTGSGKSTLLVALFRLIQPCDGDMRVDGRSITGVKVNSLRRQLSIVPQEPVMFSGILRENVDPLGHFTDEQVKDALLQAGLGSKSLDAEVGTSGEGWSLGEKQLVCLARVLLKKPAVLLLDEATSALDEKTEALFQRVLEEKFVDTTIVCIAHRLETLRWCRTRIEMGKGKLLSITNLPPSDARSAGASSH